MHSPTRRGDSDTEAEGHADRLTQGRTDGCLDGSRRGATFDGVGPYKDKRRSVMHGS